MTPEAQHDPSAMPVPVPAAPAAPDDSPERISRRQLFKRLGIYAAVAGAGATYATQIEPFWPQFHEMDISFSGLPQAFHNFRVTQITDLHAGRVPMSYLQRVLARVRQLKPDLLVVTGDLTHHDPNAVEPIAAELANFDMPVVASYGNHEYGIERDDNEPSCPQLPAMLERALRLRGITVLRNRPTFLDRGGQRLWIAGLDDLWFGGFDPVRTFHPIPASAAVIALSHNPDTADRLSLHHPQLILAGHTHGGQIRLPLIGPLYLNIYNRRLYAGQFQLRKSTLYVSRGVGYIHRIRFDCRPEIPTFRLRAA